MSRTSRCLLAASLCAGMAVPALAEMSPDMTCEDFTMLMVDGSTLGQQEATKMLKEAAAAQGRLPQAMADTQSVTGLAEAINNRCSTKPGMLAIDAMLEGN